MPKHRKTRKQKIQASTKHHAVSPAPISSSQHDIKIPERFTVNTQQHAFTTSLFPHQYLKPELTKIAILSAGIILGEIILSMLLNNHIIILPNITY